jgi:hypothetical protein
LTSIPSASLGNMKGPLYELQIFTVHNQILWLNKRPYMHDSVDLTILSYNHILKHMIFVDF